jgi:hypothetical protein
VELARLGVDGVHWQDFFGRPLDFNPAIGRTPDRASWEGGIEAWRAIVKVARAVNPVFAISTDSLWDGALSETMVCSQEMRDQTPLRVAFPFCQGASTLTEEDIANWTPAAQNQKVIFDLASPEDLKGWKIEGAFSVASSPGLIPRATLNSYVVGGESATGTATSPLFEVPTGYHTVKVFFQGGRSELVNGKENLALQFVDADTGSVLEELTPPGIHVLTTKKLGTEKLTGKRVRIRLIDANTNASFAWIGLRSLSLQGKQK